jgi:hypothetical protein
MTPQHPDKTRAEAIRRIQPELDKRTPEQVAKAEKTVRGHVDRQARDEGERVSFLGQIFGRGK